MCQSWFYIVCSDFTSHVLHDDLKGETTSNLSVLSNVLPKATSYLSTFFSCSTWEALFTWWTRRTWMTSFTNWASLTSRTLSTKAKQSPQGIYCLGGWWSGEEQILNIQLLWVSVTKQYYHWLAYIPHLPSRQSWLRKYHCPIK